MLKYLEFGLSHLEVPGERSISIYISGCDNHCPNCHYPELQSPDEGLPLKKHISDIIELYRSQASCVCFLGEGANTEEDREELVNHAVAAGRAGLKTCLYSGRDTLIEPWMQVFDYIKLGSYKEQFGPLSSPKTNQRMFMKCESEYIDITHWFQNNGR